ncbi:unnamed protein product [Adineta ricciae]|uniref:Uncharacterized protein n=1 Tax=Adineta ricciae TaxID=249248 RepID=A0A813UVU0_ADIRI|nr:unnamed protein product [Adineta ricciae]CAF0848010.1 unnamed protein product [Adineta ricciae]
MIKQSFITVAIIFGIVSASTNKDSIRIVNSGSTNTAGYTITVERTGSVTWIVAPRVRPVISSTTPASSTTTRNSIQLSASRTNAIFEAVQQTLPFTQYKPVFCVKSVSFGTTLHVQYRGEQTPDLSCPLKDERLIILSKYVQSLIADLHIQTFG